MNFLEFVRHRMVTAILAGTVLASISSSARADAILPATNFACTPVGSCSGSATQLPSVNGVQGVELNVTGSSLSGDFAQFVFSTTGLLSGSDIPAGTTIPYSFSFTADSTSASGTTIEDAEFRPDSDVFFSTDQQSTVVSNGFCSPSGNVHWCLTIEGSGLMTFASDIPTGTLLELSGDFEIDAEATIGTPVIDLRSQIDFNPIPEPRNASMVLLIAAALAAGVRELRLMARPPN